MSSEPATLKLFEHSYYIGTVLSAIVYGINLVVYCLIVQNLLKSRNTDAIAMKRFHAAFSTVMILLITICLAAGAGWGEQMWITARDKPGGVVLFLVTETDIWYQNVGRACTFIMIFFADLFLIYRLYVIYASSYRVVILPLLACLAAFALAILQLVMQGQNLNFYRDGKVINFGTPYYSLTLSVNLIVTLLIVYRLRQLRKEVSSVLGNDNAKVYSNISAIVIESAAPYTITAIAWIIPYSRGNSTAVCFGVLSDELACLAPLMIILRVLNRKGWNKNLVSQTKSRGMQFVACAGPVASSRYNSHVSEEARDGPPMTETMKFEEWNCSSRSMV